MAKSQAKSAISLPGAGTFPAVKLVKKAPKKADAFIIATCKGEEGLEVPAGSLLGGSQLKAAFEALVAVGAKGTAGEVVRIPAPAKAGATSIIAVGLGSPEQVDAEAVRRAAGSAGRALKGIDSAVADFAHFGLVPAVEGIILGGYVYKGIHTEDDADAAQRATVSFISSDKSEAAAFEAAKVTAEAVITARDLVNTPSNILYPASYAELLKQEGEKAGLSVDVLDEKELEAQGFGGIIAVGKGSARPPRLVRMAWEPKKAAKHVALVGKGITFDTGGISLKPGAGMWDMISDMGGSAAMASVAIAAAQLKLPVKVTAYLPLAENMPSANASRPGDVITHYGGITSEVLNTDAEGRLVLADAIARASEDNPDVLIETATLTGAQIVALGDRTAGIMGTEELRDHLAALGRSVGENAWAMPLLEEHDEEIKSAAADIRNISGSRSGGMEYAGTYLGKFVGEGIEWAHIDIAGPSYNNAAPYGYTPKKATGVPVRTVIAALREYAGV